MTNQPINDDLEDEPDEKFNPMVIVGFLNFHRRFIFGILLLVGVGYFLLQLNEQNKQSRIDAVNAADAYQAPPRLAQPDLIEPGERLAKVADPVDSKPVVLTVAQEINWLLSTAGSSKDKTPADAAIVLGIRLEKLKELLDDRELKPRQRTYCVQEHIKTVGLMSEQDHKLAIGIEGVDEKVAEVQQSYEANADQDIAALANAVVVGHLARRFIEDQSDGNFEAFQVLFLDRRDVIARFDDAREHVTKAISDVAAKVGEDPRVRKMAADYLLSVIYMNDTNVVELSKNLYFPEVDWATLPDRLMTNSPGAHADFQILLEHLKKQPDTPLVIYSNIASAIEWYKTSDKNEEAQQAIEQLKLIAPTITLDRTRAEVLRGIQLLTDDAAE